VYLEVNYYLQMIEKSLIIVDAETLGEEANEFLLDDLHLTLNINGLKASEEVTGLSLLIQIDHVYCLAKQLGQMLQSRCFAHTGLTTEQDRLVALYAPCYFLNQAQRRFRVYKLTSQIPLNTQKMFIRETKCLYFCYKIIEI
jgi:hypothetical protein